MILGIVGAGAGMYVVVGRGGVCALCGAVEFGKKFTFLSCGALFPLALGGAAEMVPHRVDMLWEKSCRLTDDHGFRICHRSPRPREYGLLSVSIRAPSYVERQMTWNNFLKMQI